MKQIILGLKQALNSRVVIALVMLFSVSLPFITPSPPKAHATSFSVNTTADTADANAGDGICADSNGDCSLRAAIREAFDLSGADTINVPAGTYTLTSNLSDYYTNTTNNNHLTILGDGDSDTIVDGGGQYAAFTFGHINNETQTLGITIKNLTVKNTTPTTADCWSGAICIFGASATIEDVTIDHNAGFSITLTPPYDQFQSPHATLVSSIKNVVITNAQNWNGLGANAGGGIFVMADGSPTDINIENISIVNNSVDNFIGIAGIKQFDLTVINSTIADNNSSGDMSAIYASIEFANLNLTNLTIANNISTGPAQLMGADGVVAISETSGGTSQRNLKNVLVANNQVNNTATNCATTNALTSLGGNLSSDSTCSGGFNHASDINNTNPLMGSLTLLNGQYVLPLLTGSPAIDTGIASGAPTTDQRGTTRPQGAGVDIGAYEFMASQGNSNTATLPNSEDAQNIQITTPAGTSISCSNSLKESEQTKQDGEYTYPLGLVEFCFSGASSSNQVTTTFVTDLTPTQVKARKYNSNTSTYFDIPGASISETTLGGKHALAVTYTITDNGDLDLDPATGSVKDPVGLAVLGSSVTAPNTGLQRVSSMPFVVAILTGVATIATVVFLAKRQKIYTR